MDFFEAQDQAQARTKRLIVYFGLAVALIVIAVYLAVTAGFFYYHSKIGSTPADSPTLFSGLRIAITAGIVIPLIGLGSLWRIIQLRKSGGPGVAESMGGSLVQYSTKRPEERKLINVVEEMAIASGIPVPAIYILNYESGINAFAAGFTLDDAAVGVTRGAIEQLDRNELQGVIAHEFSHILNGDMCLSTKLTGWIHGIMMLSILGRGFWGLLNSDSGGRRRRTVIYSGSSRRRGGGKSDSKGGAGALIIAIILVAVLITIIGFIGEFFGRLIQAAISRQREFLADAAALQFTRNPEGIGNALRRIGGSHRHSLIENSQAGEYGHAFFSMSLNSRVDFLATHPPLEDRIQRILKDWNGEYLRPRPRPKPERPESEKQESRQNTFGQTIFQQGSGPVDFHKMLSAGLFMRSLGQLKEQSSTYAQVIHAKLQESFPEVFEDPQLSPLMLLALLLQKDPELFKKQTDIIENDFPRQSEIVHQYFQKLELVRRTERLILFEMLTARLQGTLVPSEQEAFVACLEKLVQADNAVTSFELACLQMVRRRIQNHRPQIDHRIDLKQVIHAASILATRVAAETKLEGIDSDTLLRKTSAQAPYFMNQLKVMEASTFEEMEESFDVLIRVNLGIRQQFLQICERIVAADSTASIEEVELLRAIAISLGVPAAPIFPNQENASS